MTTLLLIALAGVVGVLLVTWFVMLEQHGKRAQIVIGVLGFTIVDSCLWADQAAVPNGLFHPGIFRIPEVLVVCALLARLIAHGPPRRIGDTAFWVLIWTLWWTTAFFVGMLNHYDMTQSLYQLKAAVYVSGGFALAAGVPAREYVKGRGGILRLIVPFAVLATVMGIMTKSGAFLSLSIPTMETPQLGNLGADTASLFVALGLLALVAAAVKRRRSLYLVVAAVPLLLSAAVSEQRAALVGLATSAAILAAAALLPPAARRFQSTPTEVCVVVAAAASLLIIMVLIPVATSGKSPTLPLVGALTTTFNGQGKRDSAQQRVNQINASLPVIDQQPVLGWGLGKTVRFYATGESKVVDTYDAHNIVLDLLLRTGAIGFIFFLIVIALVFRDGIRAWRYHPDSMVAALALASVAIMMGLLAKGMVESIFEKYRIAMALGLFMGIARAAATGPLRHPSPGKHLLSRIQEPTQQ